MFYRLKVNPQILRDFPEYCAQIIYAEGLTNGQSDDYSISVLREAEQYVRKTLSGTTISEHPYIQSWHQAFRKLGLNPKKFPTGTESLIKRVAGGHAIPAINRVVDLYNALSLKTIIPSGGEDWDHLRSDLTLHYSDGTEAFITHGPNGEQSDYPKPGEIIWADEGGATVRAWNWRQCTRTLITPETRNAYFVLDRLSPYPVDKFVKAGSELIERLKQISPSCQIHREMFM